MRGARAGSIACLVASPAIMAAAIVAFVTGQRPLAAMLLGASFLAAAGIVGFGILESAKEHHHD